jgi:hypothetical protein
MQGTSQVLCSTQKRLEEIKRVRDAIANGDSVLTDQEVKQITQEAALLGEDGDTMIGEILNQVKEVMNQPVDGLRMIEDYLRKLGRRADFESCPSNSRRKWRRRGRRS